jgi:hypothetical protein
LPPPASSEANLCTSCQNAVISAAAVGEAAGATQVTGEDVVETEVQLMAISNSKKSQRKKTFSI